MDEFVGLLLGPAFNQVFDHVSDVQRAPSDEPKQRTAKGTQIPVPKHRDFMDAFRKIARPAKSKPKQ